MMKLYRSIYSWSGYYAPGYTDIDATYNPQIYYRSLLALDSVKARDSKCCNMEYVVYRAGHESRNLKQSLPTFQTSDCLTSRKF